MELLEACRRAEVVSPSSIIELVDIALGFFSALVTVETTSNDALRRTAEVSEFQIKYDRLLAQLSTVTPEYGT